MREKTASRLLLQTAQLLISIRSPVAAGRVSLARRDKRRPSTPQTIKVPSQYSLFYAFHELKRLLIDVIISFNDNAVDTLVV